MSAQPVEPEVPAIEPPTMATPPADPKPTEPPKTTTPSANPWEDPDVAKAEIERLRKENAKDRTTSKSQAAEEARAELAQTIGKALGLVKDEAIDPAKLTEQLTATQVQAKQAALELAVFKATPDASVATALLDSRSFLAKIADIDPADAVALAAAVSEAVNENPALGKRAPAPNPAQGSSGSGPTSVTQLTEADIKDWTPEQIVAAQNEGRLNTLLGRR